MNVPRLDEPVTAIGLSRRRALLLFGMFGVTQGLTAACGPAPAAPTAAPTSAPKPAAAPPPTVAPVATTQPTSATGAPTSAAAKPVTTAAPTATTGPLVSLKTGYSNIDPDFISMYVAQDAGLYKKHGLLVDEQLVSGGAATLASVLSGEIKLGCPGGSEVLSATANGGDILVLATLNPIVPYLLYVSADIKTVEDLKGKKVGVSNFGGSADIATRAGLKDLGLDPDKDVTIVAVGSHQARTAALLSGAIQAGCDNPPGSYELEAKGARPLVDLSDKKIPFANTTIVGFRQWIAANRETTQKYIDSLVDALAFMRQNHSVAVQSLMKAYKSTDQTAMSNAFEHYLAKLAPTQPFPRPEQFKIAQQTLAEKTPKIAEIDLNSIMDPSFVQSAVDRGLAAS